MSTHESASSHQGLSTTRLEALSDGVLAIVITLLVLTFADKDEEIVKATNNQEVWNALMALWPHVLGFILSFILIAIYWILHHIMFHQIRRSDRTLLWINVAFLLAVAFLPFPTELLAERHDHETNLLVVLYGISHVVTGLTLVAMWAYAVYWGKLVAPDLDPKLIASTMRSAVVGPVLYAIGIAVSFVSVPLGLLVYGAIPLYYIIPRHADRHWHFPGLFHLVHSKGTPSAEIAPSVS